MGVNRRDRTVYGIPLRRERATAQPIEPNGYDEGREAYREFRNAVGCEFRFATRGGFAALQTADGYRARPTHPRTNVMRCSQPVLTIVNYKHYEAWVCKESSVPRGRIRARIQGASLVMLLISSVSWAQNGSPESDDSEREIVARLVEQVKQLQQQDRDLQARIKILEAKQPQAALLAEVNPALPSTPPPTEEQVSLPQ